jgi:II/X family phage/plasmid replication protein
MIDTVKFKVTINDNLKNLIINKSISTKRINNNNNQTLFNFSNLQFEGSFSHKINLFLNNNDIFIELSLPKLAYGHNVYLLYPQDIKIYVIKLYKRIIEIFPNFPDYNNWELYRLDLCYCWKFESIDELNTMIDVVQSFNYPKKKKYLYANSVMFVGNSYSVKFYNKYDEFFKHDFKFLSSNNIDLAYQTLFISENVLRFEVTLRHKWLKTNNVSNNIFDIEINWYYNQIKYFFDKFTYGLKISNMSDLTTYKLIREYYPSSSKCSTLFSFYLHYKNHKKLVPKVYSSSTIYQYLRELKKANIPLSISSAKQVTCENFSIPSKLVTNPQGVVTPADCMPQHNDMKGGDKNERLY